MNSSCYQIRMSHRLLQTVGAALMLLVVAGFPKTVAATSLSGNLTDPQGSVVSGATVRLVRRADSLQPVSPNAGAIGAPVQRTETQTDKQGQFFFANLAPGDYRLSAESPGFAPITRTIALADDDKRTERMQFSEIALQSESLIVSADVSDLGLFEPDPAQRIMVRDETLDANPGRPGMPISIPGMPVESPAGGIKPPQYFVPGVVGDHGEPIAMFFQVGGFLFPNNLPANAHGNGYADPNVIIPIAIGPLPHRGKDRRRGHGGSLPRRR